MAKTLIKRILSLLTALILVMTMIGYTDTTVITHADKQADLEKELADLKEQQDKYEDLLKSAKDDLYEERQYQKTITAQIETTEEYIRTLVELMNEYDAEIAGIEAEIALIELDILETQQLINEQKIEIDENIDLYEQRLRALYLSGNDSVASIILGATDFFDMLMKIELVTRVARYNDTLIQGLIDLKDSYENNRLMLEGKIAERELAIAEVDNKKADTALLKADWESQLADLNALYEQSDERIEELKDERDAYEENLEEIEKEAEKLEEEIQKIIAEKARANYMGDLPEGSFLWPVPGYYYVSSEYGYRWGKLHKGLDIAGSGIKGEPITAANSGEVIFVINNCKHNYGKKKSCGCGGGYGRYCIIDHGGGYTTLYAHATDIIVKEGDHVTTGDVLGYVGSTGYSTVWHLHFEIRIDGKAKDPRKFDLIIK
ncbi:MAG: peptidoglycan DD-metalloendopeptidase family protein [Oscillospiraceae bacterium]|nr:peptidoglycan DD-metalloendopeptidase family protein [Oscillospiraceae bacterium]